MKEAFIQTLPGLHFRCKLVLGAAARQASLPPQWSRSLHPVSRLKKGRIILAVALAVALPAGTVGLGLLAPPGTGRGLAAVSSPPPPPTYVPTTIPPPPGPPTLTPTTTPTPAVTATSIPTSTATSIPTPTAKPVVADFSVDAARVSKVGNPGNLQGLAEIKQGSRVWLMLYYTVNSLPSSLTRTTVYTIRQGRRILYQVTYKSAEKLTDHGRFSRFTVYSVPRSLPYGAYVYRATLSLGGQKQSKSWKFRIGPHQRVAAHAGAR